MTKEEAEEMTKQGFNQYSEMIRAKLLEKFRTVGFSNLERILEFLRLDRKAAMNQMNESDAAKIPNEEFEKLDEKTRVELLEKFQDAFAFVSNLERTLLKLRVNGVAAVSHLTKGDAAEIRKEEFEKFDEELRAKLLEKFCDTFAFVSSLDRTFCVES
ncbi:hypothetical protein TrLO_g14631 [Triparma laevis f. longispina]|uniref:Uncharacterized protein n=1 Tax=Triparma laevis f. longispina TaxID=1714387 RepID=A0A9W6ZB20_9STRA|nr:hypothetical protein TrLO_g14631 [Triparma laevis f. longispina]